MLPPVAVKLIEVVVQVCIVVPVLLVMPAVIGVPIAILAPLSSPVMAGLLLVTRIRYAVPAAVFAGMIALILPLVVPFRVPMFTALVKSPFAALNCAVKIFPVLNVPVVMNGTLTKAPTQNEVPERFVAMIMSD